MSDVVTWGNEPAAPAPLTDEDIIRITLRTAFRYRPVLGIDLSSRIAAARMRRLYARQAVAR